MSSKRRDVGEVIHVRSELIIGYYLRIVFTYIYIFIFVLTAHAYNVHELRCFLHIFQSNMSILTNPVISGGGGVSLYYCCFDLW